MLKLSEIALVSEQMRKSFSEQLRNTLAINETLKNERYNA
jgi:hypothetical protein